MERENYNSSGYESPEHEHDGDESDDSKKKKSKRAQDLARLLAKHEAATEPGDQAEGSKEKEPSLWQKLIGEKTEASSSDDTDDEQKSGAEELEEQALSEADAPLEELSEEEELLAMQAYIEARLQELAEQPVEEIEDEADDAARSVTTTWLQLLRQRLARTDGHDAHDEIDRTYEEAIVPLDDAEALEPATSAPVTAAHELPDDMPIRLASDEMPEYPTEQPRVITAPTPTVEQTVTTDEAYYYEKKAQQRGLLVGGVVGYLIGRRRGRIKTEKRLEAVHKKLEKQVVAAQQRIEQKEQQIIQLAREKYRTAPEAAPIIPTAVPERAQPQAPAQPERVSTAAAKVPESKSDRANTGMTPEAGHRAVERVPLAPRTQEVGPADHLNRQQLLELSSTMRFGETNLRRVYEAKLVDEAGLRRLIREYYAGHDLRRALAREFLVKELRFERDPQLRDSPLSDTEPTRGAVTKASDDASSVSSTGAATAVPVTTPPAITPAATPTHRRQTDTSPWLVGVLTLITIALAIYAVWLTLTR